MVSSLIGLILSFDQEEAGGELEPSRHLCGAVG